MSIIIIAVILIVIWWIAISNRLARFKVSVEESKKDVDIALAKRYDTISEMLKTAKSYARHEKVLMTELVQVRMGNTTKQENEVIANQDQALREIRLVGEAYPEMLSSQQFLELQRQIGRENDQLAAAKRIVNSNISQINQIIVSFPISLVASVKGIHKEEFLQEEDLDKKKDISDFNYDIDEK
ncbi:MAG: LemA family protein [Lachnospiraceae bacterium]|jgi:LemA protein